MVEFSSTIHWCVNCQENCNGKYCSSCSTVAGRKKMAEEQKLVKAENISKGFIYGSK